ncbi:hypothetical protein U1Q18_019801 [Sarracenia purpurea var. burkii]
MRKTVRWPNKMQFELGFEVERGFGSTNPACHRDFDAGSETRSLRSILGLRLRRSNTESFGLIVIERLPGGPDLSTKACDDGARDAHPSRSTHVMVSGLLCLARLTDLVTELDSLDRRLGSARICRSSALVFEVLPLGHLCSGAQLLYHYAPKMDLTLLLGTSDA